MEKILTILLCLVFFNLATGQVEKSNLETYWRYKARFEKEFIVLPTDQYSTIDASGVCIPAMTWKIKGDISNGKYILDFTDGNANLSHYLGMLSTEYKLLKNAGNNYDQTIKQLYYVFKAIDRLDQNSESFFRSDGSVQASDKNGWMIRDDVTPQFWANNCAKLGLPNTGVDHFVSGYAGFNNSQDGHTKESFSQDNVFHLLEGLAMVNKLVNTEYVEVAGSTVDFAAWSKAITTRLITMMQHSENIFLIHKKDDPSSCLFSPPTWWQWALDPGWSALDQTAYQVCCSGFNSQWYIKNPVTNQLAYEGSGEDFDLWGFYSYGLVRAGNKITNTSFDFNQSSGALQEQLFTSWFNGEVTGSVEAISTVIATPVFDFITTNLIGLPAPLPTGVRHDIVKELASSAVEQDPYKVKTLATLGNIFGEDTFWALQSHERERYGHFMLMYILLHGAPASYNSSSLAYNNDKEYFRTLLSMAPCKGPRNFRVSSNDDFNFEWSAASRLVWPENRGLQTDVFKKMEHNGLDYMFLHNLYCLVYQSDFRKLTLNFNEDVVNKNITETAVDIIMSNKMSGGSTVTDLASNSIRLVPGFQGSAGVSFDGKIISSSINYSGFSQNDPCTYTFSGRQTSVSSNDEMPLISETNNESIFVVPNPNKGSFDVVLNVPDAAYTYNQIDIRDMTGQSVFFDTFHGDKLNVSLSSVKSTGIYIVLVRSGKKVYQQKLVIE